MLVYDEDYNSKQCDSDKSYNAVVVMVSPDEISIHFSGNKTYCDDLGECPFYEAANITVHNYEFCTGKHDLALIELKENIAETLATPICMPSEDLMLDNVLFSAGWGKDCEFALLFF
ncbi:hypothetical protein ANCCAN_01395 [Ancylostoma caninum]|uniref:Peptidase S1 domain-containing protein n=1 Tax=Ancylostoma caninum TaxID=29170 RepID=A0A368H6V5_ANCCA|nr:hypothetical protein ANCCAN_01395 [Ancylostoma caninum]